MSNLKEKHIQAALKCWSSGNYVKACEEYKAAFLIDPNDKGIERILLEDIPEKIAQLPSPTAVNSSEVFKVGMLAFVEFAKKRKGVK